MTSQQQEERGTSGIGKVRTVSTSALIPDPHNARKHEEKSVAAIARSIERFGQVKPIVANSKGVVIAGNGTLAACKRLGIEHIRVIYVPEDFEEKAYAIADNRTAELSEWNEPMLGKILLELSEDVPAIDLGFTEDEAEAFISDALAGSSEISETVEPQEYNARTHAPPKIQYTIVFETEAQQEVWYEFLRKMNEERSESTLAARIVGYLGEVM